MGNIGSATLGSVLYLLLLSTGLHWREKEVSIVVETLGIVATFNLFWFIGVASGRAEHTKVGSRIMYIWLQDNTSYDVICFLFS